jgi:iron complex transport system substrate-binding protein
LPAILAGAITLGMNSTAPRVVSLIASATEIVHALGAGEAQVARSHECDWPPAVLDLPALTRAKFKVEGSSRAIDTAVRALVEQGLAVYEVDADALQALAPNVILTQDQCEVCAVSLADVERAVCAWVGSAPQIVSLKPHSMADVYADIRAVATALGRAPDGDVLVDSMRRRIAAIAAAVAARPKPRLAFIEWIDPPMSGGHWMPELIEAAGGVNLFGETGATSPWIAWEQVAAADPDVILVAPCGYDIATTTREMGGLAGNTTWNSLRAVRDGSVFIADGNAYFNRPGPRLVESAEILAEILHPEVCDFGHRGRAFVPYSGSTAPLRTAAGS